jgi:hypothetical protein
MQSDIVGIGKMRISGIRYISCYMSTRLKRIFVDVRLLCMDLFGVTMMNDHRLPHQS